MRLVEQGKWNCPPRPPRRSRIHKSNPANARDFRRYKTDYIGFLIGMETAVNY